MCKNKKKIARKYHIRWEKRPFANLNYWIRPFLIRLCHRPDLVCACHKCYSGQYCNEDLFLSHSFKDFNPNF